MIYKYTPITDEYTTHRIAFPVDEGGVAQGQIIAAFDGAEYAYVPDDAVLPDQPEQITLSPITDDDLPIIKANSPQYRLINKRVVERLRQQFSADDEFKLNRIATGHLLGRYTPTADEMAEIEAFDAAAIKARDWGRTEKAKIGL